MDLLFTKPDLLLKDLDGGPLPPHAEDAWRRIRDEATKIMSLRGIFFPMPFVIREDGAYDEEISRVLRGMCSSPGVDRDDAMVTYGYRVFTFLRWVRNSGLSWKTLAHEKFQEYSRHRSAPTDRGGGGLSRSSWNTELSAITAFYKAALQLKLVAASPVKMREAWGVNKWGDLAREAGHQVPEGRKKAGKRKIKWIRLDKFVQFRDEGLRKLRFPERNAAFANFVLVTGARRAEGAGLRAAEVPELNDPAFLGRRTVKWAIPDRTAKGGQGRDAFISKLALQSMIAYRDVERDTLIELAKENGRYSTPPGAFWLNQDGLAMSMRGWNAVFAASEEMCGIHCTPHMLRHSFAVYTLHNLVQISIKSASEAGASFEYRKITRDPCRELQRLLGHADWETTLIYLDYIHELDGHTDERLDYFDRRILLEADYGR